MLTSVSLQRNSIRVVESDINLRAGRGAERRPCVSNAPLFIRIFVKAAAKYIERGDSLVDQRLSAVINIAHSSSWSPRRRQVIDLSWNPRCVHPRALLLSYITRSGRPSADRQSRDPARIPSTGTRRDVSMAARVRKRRLPRGKSRCSAETQRAARSTEHGTNPSVILSSLHRALESSRS